VRQPPIPGQVVMVVPGIEDGYVPAENYKPTADVDEATVSTSLMAAKPGTHKVAIDLDLPAKLIPSSTPGHYHLYIDHEIPEAHYFALLEALEQCGLIEPGYLGASLQRGFTAVRLPWVRKGPRAVSSAERRAKRDLEIPI
jgi:hypothetical protein